MIDANTIPGFYGKLAYIGITAFQVVIALVPGEPVEFVAGYAFGPVWGTVLCIIGIIPSPPKNIPLWSDEESPIA